MRATPFAGLHLEHSRNEGSGAVCKCHEELYRSGIAGPNGADRFTVVTEVDIDCRCCIPMKVGRVARDNQFFRTAETIFWMAGSFRERQLGPVAARSLALQ